MNLKCLLLMLTFIAVGEAAAVAQAPTEFKDWKMNSEQMPRLTEIDRNSIYVIRMGHLLLTYEPGDWKRRGLKQKPVQLESMVRVGKAVTASEPDAAFLALVNQQLEQKQTFQFQKANLAQWGASGDEDQTESFLWEVVWKRFPVYGGLVEEPELIKALVDSRGSLIPHDRYLIDTVPLLLPKPEFDPDQNPRYRETERPRIWPCAKLKLEAADVEPQKKLSPSEIEKRARQTFDKMVERLHGIYKAESFQFQFVNLQRARLPWRLNAEGQIESLYVWAVQFQEVRTKRLKTPPELFTVWVKEDGTVADLRLIDERDRN
ncbi:hypothetical protein [Gimesia algae]|uniref:TraB/GumN family protein n=1 Tax=Gimesia algae TaxID=2527971 RepID=A0A517V7U6_9PLAN|nr:hypothetical protein [Gimesia algae]QDT89083.1 hypothetical protein Pan161_07080 [Gimesia algae]